MDNKQAVEWMKHVIEYGLESEGIDISCGWDGDTKASQTIPPEVARWLLDWCSDTLDSWNDPN